MFDVANREVEALIGEDLPAELLRDDPFGDPADAVLEAAYADAASPLELPSIDQIEPGPVLADLLALVDVDSLSGDEQLAVLRAQRRMAAHYEAAAYGSMAAVADTVDAIEDDPALAAESTAAEIRVALALTRRAADTELHLALRLRRRLPTVWSALYSGDIDVRRARVLVDGTEHLSVARARRVVDQILEDAPALTTGQLGARLRRLCVADDPEEATDRYRSAVAQRRVVTEPTHDGTAHLLGFDLPPHLVTAVSNRINRLARSLRRRGEDRTMDQLRADVFLDLLLGRKDGAGGVVDIRVDLDTLTRLADHPGELAGYGPVVADIARQIAERQRSQWRYTVTDSETGTAIDSGITRRRPTAAQRRAVEARDGGCVFPGCRMPASACDVDHRTAFAEGGPTATCNLRPLCRHDHRIKHTGWTYTPLDDGTYQWTSRLGAVYITKPP